MKRIIAISFLIAAILGCKTTEVRLAVRNGDPEVSLHFTHDPIGLERTRD